MKLFGFVFFLSLSIWTWNVIHAVPDISFETHASIQEKLSEMILESLRVKKPEASDLQIQKMWTETLAPGRMKAHFSYSFKEDSAQTGSTWSSVDGNGILELGERSPETGDEKWILSRVQIQGDSVKFEDSLVIEAKVSTP
jgi:hypothetical protein